MSITPLPNPTMFKDWQQWGKLLIQKLNEVGTRAGASQGGTGSGGSGGGGGTGGSGSGGTVNSNGFGKSFLPWVTSDLPGPAVFPVIGLSYIFPAGTGIINNTTVNIPQYATPFPPHSIIDLYLNEDESWHTETQDITTYNLLPHINTKLHVWQISTDATNIVAVTMMANTMPVVKKVDDYTVTIDTFAEFFYLYNQTIPWTANTPVEYGKLLLTAAGDVYLVFANGTTGATAPTLRTAPEFLDGSATIAFYCRKGYLGSFRYGYSAGIQHYFTNVALTRVLHRKLITGSPLSSPAGTEMAALTKTYILNTFQNVVGDWASLGTYASDMKIALDGYIWFALKEGTTAITNAAFIASRPHSIGQQVVDGSVTWQAFQVNYASQNWFWFDTKPTFVEYPGPDATDSNASTFFFLIERYMKVTGDTSWFLTQSPHPGKTYKDVFDNINYFNISSQMSNFLVRGEQNDIIPSTGVFYNIQFFEDNCENYAGQRAAAWIYNKFGYTALADLATYNKGLIGSGLYSMFNQSAGLFAVYYGDPMTWVTDLQTGWYANLQCQMFAELYEIDEISDDIRHTVRQNLSKRWPNWWADRGLNVFPEIIFGYMAAKKWQDPIKAQIMIDKYDRYYANFGVQVITDMAMFLALKEVVIPTFTPLIVEAKRMVTETIDGQIVIFASPTTGLAEFSNVSGGECIVPITSITTSSLVQLTPQGPHNGQIYEDKSSRVAGVSFTIRSTDDTDNPDVAWAVSEPG